MSTDRITEWESLGKFAKRHGLTDYNIRQWCNAGLLEYEQEGPQSTRLIPISEDKKVKRIKELKKQLGAKTPTQIIKKQLIEEGFISAPSNVVVDQQPVKDESDIQKLIQFLSENMLTKGDLPADVLTKDDMDAQLKLLTNNQPDMADTNSKIDSLTEALNGLKAELKIIKNENSELTKENTELKSKLDRVRTENEQLHNKIEELENKSWLDRMLKR